MVNDTDIIELELKSKKFNLNLRKREAVVLEQQQHQMQVRAGARGAGRRRLRPAACATAGSRQRCMGAIGCSRVVRRGRACKRSGPHAGLHAPLPCLPRSSPQHR